MDDENGVYVSVCKFEISIQPSQAWCVGPLFILSQSCGQQSISCHWKSRRAENQRAIRPLRICLTIQNRGIRSSKAPFTCIRSRDKHRHLQWNTLLVRLKKSQVRGDSNILILKYETLANEECHSLGRSYHLLVRMHYVLHPFGESIDNLMVGWMDGGKSLGGPPFLGTEPKLEKKTFIKLVFEIQSRKNACWLSCRVQL